MMLSLLSKIAVLGAAWLSMPVLALEVTVVFGVNVAPYVLPDAKPPAGLEVDLFRAALAVRGHTMRPVFVQRGAIIGMLRRQKADAAQRGAPALREGEFYYAAETTYPYRDVAVTLKKNKLAIYSVADLRGKKIVAFPGATQYLGTEYAAAIKASAEYNEMADEKDKLALLLQEKVQVYIGDIHVFEHMLGSLPRAPQPAMHHIFLPSTLMSNNAVFREASVRDDFNAGLKAIRESGQYQQIARRYLR